MVNVNKKVAAILVIVLMITLAGCSSKSSLNAPTASVSERVIEKNVILNNNGYYFTPVISPDATRYAYIKEKDNRKCVVTDGVEGKLYEKIDNLMFSSDSKKVAFVAKDITKTFIVLDGKEIAAYDYMDIYNSPVFSPDSKHIAYQICKLDESGRSGHLWSSIVVDGVEGKHHQNIYGPVFSPDGNHVSYTVDLGNNQWLVVKDGVESKTYYGGPIFASWSGDSQKFFYQVRDSKTGRSYLVVDGAEGKPYDNIMLYNSNNKNLVKVVYTASDKDGVVIVIDLVERRYPGQYLSPYFSPDGNRVVYTVKLQNNKYFVAIDDKEGEQYDAIGMVWFSQDSQHYAYQAMIGDKWYPIIDGVRGQEFAHTPGMKVSPDGKRVVYSYQVKLEKSTKTVMVIDGVESKQYDSIGEVVFSPDSQRVAYVAYPNRWEQQVVEKGVEGKKYPWSGETYSSSSVHNIKPVFSPNSDHLAFTVKIWVPETKSYKYAVVYNGVEGKQYDSVGNLMFSPDGKHVVYTATNRDQSNPFGTWYVIVDNVEREYSRAVSYKPVIDSTGVLRYLVVKGNDVYLVEMKFR